jgi:hypothetical protein
VLLARSIGVCVVVFGGVNARVFVAAGIRVHAGCGGDATGRRGVRRRADGAKTPPLSSPDRNGTSVF